MSSRGIVERKKGSKLKGLTEQQKVFVSECLREDEFNISRAAAKAGYKHPSTAANKLIKQPQIKAALGKALSERMYRCEIDGDRVLQELMVIGLLDPGDMFDNDGIMMPVHEMPPAVRRAIAGIDITEKTDRNGETTVTTKIRFNPKVAALELIARHLGMLNDKISMNHDVSPDLLSNLLKEVESNRGVIVDDTIIEATVHNKDG